MKWEIERHVPFASEQVVMDYQPLVPPEEVPDGQNMEVLLAVAQEGLVTRHVEAVQAAGLQPLAIDIEPLATSRSLIDLANGTGPAGTCAIIDLGASTTDISIYRDGRIAFTRSIQLAGNNLTKAISDVLGRPLADAERLKKDLAAVPEMPQNAGGATLDPFGDQFGGLGTIDFGSPEPEVLGGVLGGTFGAAPGTSTATDTQSEPAFNIAGGGFTEEAFTSSPDATPAADPAAGASPFGAPAEFDLGGPQPAANPFDPDAAPAPDPAATNPFEAGIFGPAPAGDPFAPPSEPLGAPAPMAVAPSAPAAMSEEEYLKTQISDAVMPVLHEIVTELRRSLDFYRNRANGLGAQQVVICGGTAKLPGLADFLAANLEVPVAVGNPLSYLAAGPKADSQYLQDVGPFFSVSVGLAARELMQDTVAPRPKTKKR
jgi:type IV pilus assembly protein PilM